jgi:crotonobetainyl-CoA:carnitine CoA-transferase CaiB-like acyl-CoA transferase
LEATAGPDPARWLRTRPAAEAAASLQRRRIPAVPVLDARERLGHPYFALRGTHISVELPIFGNALVYDLPWRLAGANTQPRGGPLVGQDNEAIAPDLLGLAAGEVEQLTEAGLFEQDLSEELTALTLP